MPEAARIYATCIFWRLKGYFHPALRGRPEAVSGNTVIVNRRVPTWNSLGKSRIKTVPKDLLDPQH